MHVTFLQDSRQIIVGIVGIHVIRIPFLQGNKRQIIVGIHVISILFSRQHSSNNNNFVGSYYYLPNW
jgi:hypothetical protein